MQLVGCTPHIWAVGALEQPLHCSFCYCWSAQLHRQCRVTEESASCMQHSLLPTGGAVENLSLHCWSLISPGMKTTLCSSSPISVLVSLKCLCTSAPVDVCLWSPYLCICICSWLVNPQADWMGSTPPLPLSSPCSSSVSLCHLFPCAMEQKLSLEWLDITLLTLCLLLFILSLLGKSFESDLLFIYLLLVSFTFWVVWRNIGLTSLQIAPCCYFILSAGLFREPKPTTAISNYSAAGSATCADCIDIIPQSPIEQTKRRKLNW